MDRDANSFATALASNYQPVAKMQEKSAQLRDDLSVMMGPAPSVVMKTSPSMKPLRKGRSGAFDAGQQSPPVSPQMSRGILRGGRASPTPMLVGMDSTYSDSVSGEADFPSSSRRSPSPVAHRRGVTLRPAAHGSAGGNGNNNFAALVDRHQVALNKIASLEMELQDQRAQQQELQGEMRRQQESYIRREDQQAAVTAELQQKLAVAEGASTGVAVSSQNASKNAAFGRAGQAIKELHSQMVSEIEELLEHQAASLRHEEQGTLKQFRSKLTEVEAQVAAERAGLDKYQREWMDKTVALRKELEQTQDIANKLDRMYKLADEECGRLRAQFKCQEDDREYLIRQIVGLKKECQRVTAELAAVSSDLKNASVERDQLLELAGSSAAATGGGGGGGGAGESRRGAASPSQGGADVDPAAVRVKVQRYEDVIDSLKRLLEAERRRTKLARAAHTAELQQRTELQALLRKAVEDVRARMRSVAIPLADINQTAPAEADAAEGEGNEEEEEDDEGGYVDDGADGHGGGGHGQRSFRSPSPTAALTVTPPQAMFASRKANGRPASGRLDVTPAARRPFSAAAAEGMGSSGAFGSSGHRPASSFNNVRISGDGGKASRRPFSAMSPASAQRRWPVGPAAMEGAAQGRSGAFGLEDGSSGRHPDAAGTAAAAAAAAAAATPLNSKERSAVIQELLANESVIKLLYDAAFPGLAPHPPGDPYLEQLANFQDARDQQVVANARALATLTPASRQGAGGTPASGRAARPSQQGGGGGAAGGTGSIAKEAANKRWVLNVDALMSQFLATPARPGTKTQ